MKLIVDFDDVLFDVSKLKEKFFKVLTAHGVKNPKDEYHFERKNDRPFSLKLFLARIHKEENLKATTVNEMYEEVMTVCGALKNKELADVLTQCGRENCHIVTSGDKEFQMDKIMRSGANNLAQEIIVVPGSKKDTVESICLKYSDEKVIFIDDKVKFFDDITMEKYPNLKTILFDEQGLIALQREIKVLKERL